LGIESYPPRLTRRQFLKMTGALAIGVVLFGSARCSLLPEDKHRFSRHYDFLAHFSEAQVQASDPAYVKVNEVIQVAGEGRFCLFEHPLSQVTFPAMPIYQNGRLEFGVGMHQDAWDRTDDGVLFFVEALDQAGNTHRLYQRQVDPHHHLEDRRWFDESVDLSPFAGQSLQFIFRTEPGRNNQYDWAAWSTPRFVSWEERTGPLIDRPNILFITVDTCRVDHLSCYGYPRQTTPTLDRIAREGIRFTGAYSQSEITLPSHSTMLTGLYPRTHGAIENGTVLAAEITRLPELLKAQGYRTVGVPSAYLLGPPLGIEQGFTDFYQCRSVRRPGDEATDTALEWLVKQRQEPFFLWVHYFDAHAPYLPTGPYNVLYSASGSYAPYHLPASAVQMPVNWRGWYKEDWPPPYNDIAEIITQYDGGIRFVDIQVGRLLSWLEENGLTDNTMVILTGDHGEGFGEHGVTFEHFGTHEEMLHVPLIISYPPRLPMERVVTDLVGHVDLAPTILDLLGLAIPKDMQGTSLLPLIEQRSWPGHEGIFSQQRGGRALSIRTTGWRLIMQLATDTTWPLYQQQPGQAELYDVQADSKEAQNLWPAKSNAAQTAERKLGGLILSWKENTPATTGTNASAQDPQLLKMLHDLGY
jgi:arylsulfatase A-like enzyme